MKQHTTFSGFVHAFSAAVLLTAAAAQAEDIDLYAMNASTADIPNVLFIIDNSGNWNASLPSAARCNAYVDSTALDSADSGSKVGIELCALFKVVTNLANSSGATAKARIGVMLFNSETGNEGAYPRIALTEVNSSTVGGLQTKIKGITSKSGFDTSNRGYWGLAMHEAYLYFKGMTPLNGAVSTKHDTGAFTPGGTYNSPASASCSRNYIIFIGNGSPNTAGVDAELTLLQTITNNTAQIAKEQAGNPEYKNWSDEYARALRNVDLSSKDGTQSIKTFSIAVTGATSDPSWPSSTPYNFSGYYAFMNSLGLQGGGSDSGGDPENGQYFYKGSSVDAVAAAIEAVLAKILAVNSVFASASLPVSVNTQGVYKNQVFIGMFRPDESMLTRWYGNMKQYKLSYNAGTDNITMVDANNNAAISSVSGFVDDSAVSFWTTGSSFWVNDLKGASNSSSDSPDGGVPELGAAAQVLRTAYATSQANRPVYTCVGCADGTDLSATTAAQFESSNTAITAAALGVADAERATLIDWIRGTDNKTADENGPGGSTTVRPSIHGDVLHSRPAVVDYGGTTGTVVFYGANDGTLRAVNGNQSGTDAGMELWAFVPQELFGGFKRLRDNAPTIKYPTNTDATATPRDYFVDGPLTIYQHKTSGKVYLYSTMRRGGRFMYAFDVSTPSQPVLLWKASSASMSELGQTWSEPRLGRIRGNTNPVVIMGAGYDAVAEDAASPGTTTMGNAVLVLDAFTGVKLRSFATTRSVPASVALIDSDFDGYTDRAYVSDIGGNVYRLDLETSMGSTAAADWTLTKIADLSLSGFAHRKFLFHPDVIVTNTFAAVMLGSGNRELPLYSSDTRDQFITLFDYKMTKGAPTSTATTMSDLGAAGSWDATSLVKGCYYSLPNAGIGEKIVNAPLTVGGRTLFSTNTPTASVANSCGNLGTARAYAMPVFCGTPTFIELLGGGLPPTPVTGLVDLGNGVIQRFLIGGSPSQGASPGSDSPIGASKPPVATDTTRRRMYWFQNRSF